LGEIFHGKNGEQAGDSVGSKAASGLLNAEHLLNHAQNIVFWLFRLGVIVSGDRDGIYPQFFQAKSFSHVG